MATADNLGNISIRYFFLLLLKKLNLFLKCECNLLSYRIRYKRLSPLTAKIINLIKFNYD